MKLSRGDVVLVVLQGELGKPRPAVVVQADELGSERRTVIVCPMSSGTADTPLLRPIVEVSADNGLHARSQIMIDKIASVKQDRIRRVLGRLDEVACKARPWPLARPRVGTAIMK